MATKKKSTSTRAKAGARPPRKTPSSPQAIDPLLTRVLADPSDEALRQVWSDSLIERNDPRGELVAIQVAATGRKLTPAEDKRLRSLVAKHRVEWLGDLANIVQHREGLVFERGLLDACQIQIKSLDALTTAIGHPLWAAVQSMWFCDRYAWDPRIVPLLTHPVLGRLRTVWCVGLHNVFAALMMNERPLPFTSIWTINDAFRKPEIPRAFSQSEMPGLPHLRRLGFTRNEPEWLLALPIFRHIETLGITNHEPAGAWLTRTQRLEQVTTLELRRQWVPLHGPQRPHFRLRFHRDAQGRWSNLEIRGPDRIHPSYVNSLVECVESIPAASLERVALRDDGTRQLDAFIGKQVRARFKRAEIVLQ